jgi:predicted flavoprotein YhiN
MTDLITEARELATENISQPTVFYKDKSQRIMLRLCDALEKANSKLDYLHEDIDSVRAQLHTATFSTNKGAAAMAKFILALLPAPPEKEGE